MTSDELKLAAEYNRGYTDGKKAKTAEQWWLANDREEVVRKLREVKLDGESSREKLSEICRCIYPADWWTPGACMALREELIELLGGGDTPSGPKPICVVLSSARHKAACRLEECRPLLGMTKTEILGDLGKAITNAPNFNPTDVDHLNMMWSNLIYLLDGDNGTMSQSDGTRPNGVPIYADDFAMRPLPTPNHDFANATKQAPKVTEQSITITSDLRNLVHSTQFEAAEDADPFIAIADQIDQKVEDLARDVVKWRDQAKFMKGELDASFERCTSMGKRARENGEWCEYLLELLRDAAKEFKMREGVLDAAIAKLKDSIEPPEDADGRTWRIGERFLVADNSIRKIVGLKLDKLGTWWLLTMQPNNNTVQAWLATSYLHYDEPETTEQIIRDLTLGRITEREAIEKLEELK